MINWLARPHVLPAVPSFPARAPRAPMTLAQLRRAVRDAMEDHKLTIAGLARELAPFYRPDTVYKYLRPTFTRVRPQARFVHLAGEALARLIARKGTSSSEGLRAPKGGRAAA